MRNQESRPFTWLEAEKIVLVQLNRKKNLIGSQAQAMLLKNWRMQLGSAILMGELHFFSSFFRVRTREKLTGAYRSQKETLGPTKYIIQGTRLLVLYKPWASKEWRRVRFAQCTFYIPLRYLFHVAIGSMWLRAHLPLCRFTFGHPS